MDDNASPVIVMVSSDAAMCTMVGDYLDTHAPWVSFLTVSTEKDAENMLAATRVRIVLVDAGLPGGIAKNSLERLNTLAPWARLVLLCPQDASRGTASLAGTLDAPCVDMRQEPEKLLGIILHCCPPQQHEPPAPKESRKHLREQIMHLCLHGETAQLRVVSGERLGTVVVRDGVIFHAQVAETSGEEALREMLAWPGATWEVVYLASGGRRTIFADWRVLLGLRRPPDVPPPVRMPVLETAAAGAPLQPVSRRKKTLRIIVWSISAAGMILAVVTAFLVWSYHAGFGRRRVAALAQAIFPKAFQPPASTNQPPPANVIRVIRRRLTAEMCGKIFGKNWLPCEVHVAWYDEFASGANTVFLSPDIFDKLQLTTNNPWIMIAGPRRRRLGAHALRRQLPGRAVMVMRRSMAEALGLDPRVFACVGVRRVEWKPGPVRRQISFQRARKLPQPYCRHPFSAGLALATLLDLGLPTDSYALARGPTGYQSVHIQVMDRGNPTEIWLSKEVRRAVGVTSVWDQVTLYLPGTRYQSR